MRYTFIFCMLLAGGCASYYSDFMGLFTVDIGAPKDAKMWYHGSAKRSKVKKKTIS